MKIVKILLVLVVLVVLAVGGLVAFVVLNADSVLRSVIERGASYATQTEASLDSADLSFAGGGGLSFDDLTIDNPEGFDDSPHFMSIDEADSSFNVGAREITSLTFKGIDMHLDGVGESSNHARILESLKRFESGDGAAAEDKPMGVVVRSLVFEDVKVHVRNVRGVSLVTGDVAVEIPRVELNDLGEREMTWGEMFNLVIKTLMSATIEAGGGVLPADLLGGLSGKLGDLESLKGEVVTQISERAQEAIEGARDRVEEQIDGARDRAREKIDERVGGALGGLLGGGDEDDESASDEDSGEDSGGDAEDTPDGG